MGTSGSMFLFCGHVNPPGTSSCDKAQVIAAARSEWSKSATWHAHWEAWRRARSEATRGAGLRADASKPCGTLQYCVMAWEFILNTASSGKDEVLATWMGASGTRKMWSHGH